MSRLRDAVRDRDVAIAVKAQDEQAEWRVGTIGSGAARRRYGKGCDDRGAGGRDRRAAQTVDCHPRNCPWPLREGTGGPPRRGRRVKEQGGPPLLSTPSTPNCASRSLACQPGSAPVRRLGRQRRRWQQVGRRRTRPRPRPHRSTHNDGCSHTHPRLLPDSSKGTSRRPRLRYSQRAGTKRSASGVPRGRYMQLPRAIHVRSCIPCSQ